MTFVDLKSVSRSREIVLCSILNPNSYAIRCNFSSPIFPVSRRVSLRCNFSPRAREIVFYTILNPKSYAFRCNFSSPIFSRFLQSFPSTRSCVASSRNRSLLDLKSEFVHVPTQLFFADFSGRVSPSSRFFAAIPENFIPPRRGFARHGV